jgi:cytochrome c2
VNGDTTSFGIPAPLTGNLGAGASYFPLACSSCHGEKGTNFTFDQLKAAVTGPKMNITSVTDQQYANLVAFLNRSFAPTNCGTGPTPTPTPIDDRTAGNIVFDTTCKTCHPRVTSDLRQLSSASQLRSTIRDVRQMNNISLSNEQIRVLLIYLHSM